MMSGCNSFTSVRWTKGPQSAQPNPVRRPGRRLLASAMVRENHFSRTKETHLCQHDVRLQFPHQVRVRPVGREAPFYCGHRLGGHPKSCFPQARPGSAVCVVDLAARKLMRVTESRLGASRDCGRAFGVALQYRYCQELRCFAKEDRSQERIRLLKHSANSLQQASGINPGHPSHLNNAPGTCSIAWITVPTQSEAFQS
jgi:hypothetical protein